MQTAGLAGAAKVLQDRGRGSDSMLVHMTPGEVGGLQALALASGGSLTTNPDTGLPEAGFLSDILPTLIGVGMNFILPGSGLLVAGLTGLGTGIATGDLGKGLMAGLGAFGGASLGAGLFGSGAAAAEGASSGIFGGLKDSFSRGILGAGEAAKPGTGGLLGGMLGNTPAAGAPELVQAGANFSPQDAASINSALIENAPQAAPGFAQNFVGAAQGLDPTTIAPGLGALGDAGWKTGAAGLGVLSPFLKEQGGATKPDTENKYPYEGPYTPTPRRSLYPTRRDPRDSSEFQYFDNVNPVPGFVPTNMAAGGVGLDDGAFVMDARSVAELGNGSSGAGQEVLANLGGTPIRGPGHGTSDTIRANVGGTQEARVSRDEVKFDYPAVTRIGGGSHSKGTQKLQNLMNQARNARKNTPRGQSNGLGGLA